ncbi:NGG1p interacting factor NIF3 [Motiliproteus sp. MSK22-1]|uniref:NGG1p interacting factor NIF3 n=1 Tax=Motiliproteus sp. MSK22-1 TaxID=1897630 RepID=UPI000976521A|nr:NGG1p interacting factor NIF3 [Motiliproteus sp. MSK22-1]OMH35307.1 NGG1p interacting factor NIF3 [Motiliproteus sp. MSK22-1]
MYKLCFFVPESHVETVKNAVFLTGAGYIGNYDQCCWQVMGTGQFRALQGSQPFTGLQGQLHKLSEWKVEIVCEDHLIEQAVAAMKKAHPYEEVAYDVIKLEVI